MSKDLIKKFLAGASEHADTTEVKIGDQVVTLGDLRSLNSEERTDLSTKIKEAETNRAKALDIANKAQGIFDQYQSKLAALPANTAPAAASGTDPFADPWLAPVKKALEDRDKATAELKDMLKTVVTIVGNAANTFSEDRWDREYAGINFGKREKRPTRDELIEFAKTNNLVDRHKLPSVTAAWDKMNQADREDEMKKAEFEKGRDAGRMETLANRLPPPGVPGPGPAPLPKPGVPGNGELGDLYVEALKDPELRALMEQLPAGMA